MELWHRVGSDAARFAFLLEFDAEAARDIAERAFGRCIARMQDRRSTDLLDVWFRRDVVRLVARRTRARRIRNALGREGPVKATPFDGSSSGRELWSAFTSLPLTQRAAIVLDVYEHMPRPRAADALGRSVAGTSRLIDRGWATLETRLGVRPDGPDLERLLTAAAERFEAAPADPVDVRRLARRARAFSIVVAICLAGGGVTGAIVATSALSTAQREARESRSGGDDRDEGSSEGGSTVGLGFTGAPGWCPDPRRTLTISEETGREATRVAMRVAISIVKGYTNTLAHLIEVPVGAPPPRRWAAPAGAGRLRILARGLGGLNDTLAIECGVQVADRTWIAIIEDGDPPAGDAVAFYVILRPSGFKVWGSYGALGS